jgi:flavin reductase (DIM6/NTAB) family NADH-FMN oxidoreductase RutF
LNSNDYFTLSFYNPEDKKRIHGICGSKSGRDVDKIKECGLTPCFYEKAPYFTEAKIVLICRKMAKSKIDPEEFIDKSIVDKWYPGSDFHFVYYGAIEKVLICE